MVSEWDHFPAVQAEDEAQDNPTEWVVMRPEAGNRLERAEETGQPQALVQGRGTKPGHGVCGPNRLTVWFHQGIMASQVGCRGKCPSQQAVARLEGSDHASWQTMGGPGLWRLERNA